MIHNVCGKTVDVEYVQEYTGSLYAGYGLSDSAFPIYRCHECRVDITRDDFDYKNVKWEKVA